MKIKALIPVFILFLLVGTLRAQKNEKVIEISNKYTKSRLDSLVTALAGQKILLTLAKTEFDNNGYLKAVSGMVYFSRKNNGSFSCDKLGIVIIRSSKREFRILVREEK